MIAMLRGTIVFKSDPYVIVDVHDVGYKILIPKDLLLQVKISDELQVYTHTHVREDLLELYGFISIDDLRVFEQLIGVSGVGCKTALGIFSVGNRLKIIDAIRKGDVAFFTGVPRLGRKNAQKIIIELKNKFSEDRDLAIPGEEDAYNEDLIVALRSFGFTTKESQEALRAIGEKAVTPEDKIRLALQYLGK